MTAHTIPNIHHILLVHVPKIGIEQIWFESKLKTSQRRRAAKRIAYIFLIEKCWSVFLGFIIWWIWPTLIDNGTMLFFYSFILFQSFLFVTASMFSVKVSVHGAELVLLPSPPLTILSNTRHCYFIPFSFQQRLMFAFQWLCLPIRFDWWLEEAIKVMHRTELYLALIGGKNMYAMTSFARLGRNFANTSNRPCTAMENIIKIFSNSNIEMTQIAWNDIVPIPDRCAINVWEYLHCINHLSAFH